MSDFNLDREMNVRENIDATGKKWVIYTERGRHLFFARPEPDRADAVIPKELSGRWTKKMLLDEAIKLHVKSSWDHAEEVTARNARKAQAAKEAAKHEHTEKAKASASEDSDANVVSENSGNDKRSTKKSSKS